MNRFAQDFDDLERLIDGNAAKDEIRSQLRFIAREVAALEADYARAIEEHAQFQLAQSEPSPEPSQEPPLQHLRGIYYASGDPVPFCPNCYETGAGKRIHLYGPVALFEATSQRWDCYTCNTIYVAKPNEHFLPHKNTGRYRNQS